MSSKSFLKIIIPVAMVAIVIALWLSSGDDANSQQQTSDPDFALNTTNVDLAALSEHNLPMIIDFGADECIPCKEMAPVLIELNEDYQGKAIIKFVDVWKTPQAASGFPVQVIPTQIFVNADGTPYVPSEDLGIQFIMYAEDTTNEHIFTAHQGGLTEDQLRLILDDMGVS